MKGIINIMLKNKTHKFRKISSAAIIGIAIYGSSLSPVWASELRHTKKQEIVKIQMVDRKNKIGQETVGEGVVKSLEQNLLIVTRKKDGKDFSVATDDKTKIFQGFGKKIAFEQVLVGDKVFVKGSLLNGDSSTITARIIRDMSLKLRSPKT